MIPGPTAAALHRQLRSLRRRGALLVAFAVIGEKGVAAALPAQVEGQRIYEQQCASCHGAKGEGVKDKYDEALSGDWSMAKLTRYVAANMPDDDPGTLAPAEAEAVSRYLHDAFYSREARARLNPARIELAHLTNQQFVLTVADLLRRFAGPENTTAGEAGLTALYYSTAQRGRFEAGKMVHRGSDASLDFDLANGAKGAAIRAQVGSDEFSIQWRGSILAEETGEYEFVVRTPNSVRVWINAELTPSNAADALIDVNVSTPTSPDHRVTLRLIGGRSYPIGIDYWALPGKTGAPPPAFALHWKPPHGSERAIPARNLGTNVSKPTFVVATRFPADDSSQGYERGSAVSKAWDDATTGAAFEVANYVGKNLDRMAGTKAGDAARGQKLEIFTEKFVTAAFRRPLSADEKRLYITDRFKAVPDPAAAVKRAVLLTLKSPQFLYTEIPNGRPDEWRVAARLAFGLWDSLPDNELALAAARGQLRTRDDVAAQARRMLTDPRARAKMREFFQQWLQLRYIEDLRKDSALYADFSPEIIDDLRTSLHLFVDSVMWNAASDYRELLQAEYIYVNERLARFYDLPLPSGGEFARVPGGFGQRSGVLTHPYLLAAFSYKGSTSPIHRGVFLTRNIVGRALKSPPMAVVFNDAEFTPGLSMREKVAKLTKSETCQGCHAVINPLGFSLERYDVVGRFRQEENGRTIDAASDYITDDNETVRLAGPRDVARFAIASERANEAFIEQLFHQVVKQPITAYGDATAKTLRQSFIASGFNLQTLLVDIVTLAALHAVERPVAVTSSHPNRP